MARFEVRIKRSAAKEIAAIARRDDRRRIVQRIQGLATDPRPHGCKKLSGKHYYRLRQGAFRILYSIKDRELLVMVVGVANRSSAYRKL